MIPIINKPNEYFNLLKSGNEELSLELETQYNPLNGILNIKVKGETNNLQNESQGIQLNGKYGGWWGCMKNFYSSDAGTFVTLMSTAGGFGCAACGIVAGFTTGVMAIACIHG